MVEFENVSMDMTPYDLMTSYPIRYAVPLYGYFCPALICVTLVTNTLAVIVLLKKHMRSPTNTILAGMALSDMFMGLFPLPVFLYFFGMDYYKEYIPYDWCYTITFTLELIPQIFHTASILLTMMLAIQRYVYICHNFQSRKWPSTITKVLYGTFAIYVMSILCHLSLFCDSIFIPIEVTSRLIPNKTMVTCIYVLRPWALEHVDIYFNIYVWFRVICIHLIPCLFIAILSGLLISAMLSANRRRMQMQKQNKSRESNNLKDSISTTRMLLVVVNLFLLVELPQGIFLIVYIVDATFSINIYDAETYGSITVIGNFIIILSCPMNICIYCGMSRQFRETFKRMFVGLPSLSTETAPNT